jgi:UDP-N-acetylmuramyl pentapeptide phosphotransferase/UDP-N-acetylglucosamine-1-phosphate transferase
MSTDLDMSGAFVIGSWLALHLLVAAAGTWCARAYALHRELLDHPGERRSHVVATPRGGGVGIVFAWLLAWLLASLLQLSADPMLIVAAVAGLLLVAGVGWVDDHRPLSPWLRLGAHGFAAMVFALAIWQLTRDPVDTLLAWLSVVVLVNVWNFMDGIDGLAASQAAIAAAAYALFAGDAVTAALAWALSAACCGFLPFNFPRARIFLGDVGSGALGYALAVLFTLVAIEVERSPTDWLLLAIPLSTFLIDASLTLCRRMLRGDRWWTAHVEHAYQQLAFRVGAHWPVTLAYAAWTCCGALILAIASRAMVMDGETAINIVIAVGWGLTGALAWAWIARTPPQDQLGRRR